jgi:hypothetical protein
MDLNTFESLCKTENKARLYFKKFCSAGKTAMFFAQRAGAIKSTELRVKSTDVSAADTSFMTLPADGLTSLIYRLKNGFGS